MEPKETTYKKVLKSNIILFLSYTILIGFIFIIAVLFFKYALSGISNLSLTIVLSLISGILIYLLLHFICKSSTLESLKKSHMDTENTNQFLRKMNLFFIICILLSILIGIGYLLIYNFTFTCAIQEAYSKYEFISADLANKIANTIVQEYNKTIHNKIYSTILIELSFVISFVSLVHYQKKVLAKYNT